VAAETTRSLLAGRYRVERLLGRGGMAAVYLAHDERLDRRVAIKRLHADSPGAAARRFAREAKLGASLSHPNLVWVFDTVADEDGVLIVMEYVPGTTLARELEAGPLRPRRAVEVISGVATALDHAHEHGVVHRDVKPANVLLGTGGTVKLADLGIARAAEHTRITSSGVVLGTASYMAPEQLDGRRPLPASDIYSLATVAFEALTGRKARRGRTPVEVAHAIATRPPPDLREAWQQAPAEAAEVLKRGMARESRHRPRTACELAIDLAAALGEERAARARFSAAKAARSRAERRDEGPSPRPMATPPVRPRPPAAPPRAEPARPAAALTAGRVAPAGPPPARARRRAVPALVAIGLIAVALLVAGIVVFDAGGGGKPSTPSAAKRSPGATPRATNPAGPSAGTQAPAPSSGPGGPSGSPSGGTAGAGAAGTGPVEGGRLNDEGFALMRQGRYAEAVRVLRRAVGAFPAGTTDVNYAYALYNLGRSLRLSGHPGEAIPVLERRLRIPNQTEVVRRELEAARRDAGQG
jgi:eukaryotic-like serine/threonine-protein kinase